MWLLRYGARAVRGLMLDIDLSEPLPTARPAALSSNDLMSQIQRFVAHHEPVLLRGQSVSKSKAMERTLKQPGCSVARTRFALEVSEPAPFACWRDDARDAWELTQP